MERYWIYFISRTGGHELKIQITAHDRGEAVELAERIARKQQIKWVYDSWMCCS